MAHLEGESRYQRLLYSPSLDEVVGEEHPVRVIDAFVDSLDLTQLGFSKVVAAATGRPPYRPSDLLKLYVYGYANAVRSSRGLEREAGRNIEVQWLINRLSPSFKTVADFRRDHASAIVGVCGAFIRFCRLQSLHGGELAAIDGTKLEAVASRKQVITPKRLEKQMAGIDKRIEQYLAGMDEADREDAAADGGPVDVAAALDALRARREQIQAQAKALADEGLTQRVIGEADARLMKTARHGHQVAYNAQAAVDAKHGLIAAFDLTNEGNDERQLLPMARAAKAALEAETLTVVADTGYSNGEHGRACEAEGITAVVPRQTVVNTRARGERLFTREDFTYDRQSDAWTCPAGQVLRLQETCKKAQTWRYGTSACRDCPIKARCTKGKARRISRHFYEDDREAMHQRAIQDRRWMKLRRELVEHPFGVMKWMMGRPRFLVRGLHKAKAELALTVLAFNLKRTVSIKGVPALLDVLRLNPA